jgi:hypothetical protein
LGIQWNEFNQFDQLGKTDAHSNISKDGLEVSLLDEPGVRLIIESKFIGQLFFV